MRRLCVMLSVIFVGAAVMAGPSFAQDFKTLASAAALANLGKSGAASGGAWREAAGETGCLCTIPPNTPNADSNGACLERDWCEKRFMGRCGSPCK